MTQRTDEDVRGLAGIELDLHDGTGESVGTLTLTCYNVPHTYTVVRRRAGELSTVSAPAEGEKVYFLDMINRPCFQHKREFLFAHYLYV